MEAGWINSCPSVLSVPSVTLFFIWAEKEEKAGQSKKRNTWVRCFRICFVCMIVFIRFGFYREGAKWGNRNILLDLLREDMAELKVTGRHSISDLVLISTFFLRVCLCVRALNLVQPGQSCTKLKNLWSLYLGCRNNSLPPINWCSSSL